MDEYALASVQVTPSIEIVDYHEGLSAETLRRQKNDLSLFTTFLSSLSSPISTKPKDLFADLSAWREITAGLVEAFRRWQVAQGYALGSVNVRLATIKAYCRVAHSAGIMTTEAYTRIQGVRGYQGKQARHTDEKRRVTRVGSKKADPVAISPAQARRLKNAADDGSDFAARDTLLICLLLDQGLRIGEVAALRVADLDLDAAILTFYRSKVHKTQKHDLSEDVMRAAQRYLADLPPVQRRLFSIKTRQLANRVQLLGEAIGVTNLSPHDCRHYWATDAVRNGTDIKSLQDAGGWASPSMPLRYAASAEIANAGVKLSTDKK